MNHLKDITRTLKFDLLSSQEKLIAHSECEMTICGPIFAKTDKTEKKFQQIRTLLGNAVSTIALSSNQGVMRYNRLEYQWGVSQCLFAFL